MRAPKRIQTRAMKLPQEVCCKVHGAVEPVSFSLLKIVWILPPLSNSWILFIIWRYKALNNSPIIDCYCMGAVPKR